MFIYLEYSELHLIKLVICCKNNIEGCIEFQGLLMPEMLFLLFQFTVPHQYMKHMVIPGLREIHTEMVLNQAFNRRRWPRKWVLRWQEAYLHSPWGMGLGPVTLR